MPVTLSLAATLSAYLLLRRVLLPVVAAVVVVALSAIPALATHMHCLHYEGYGHALRCLNLAAQYCRDRQTFGKPLVANQVVRAKLTEMHRQVAVARTYTLEVAARYEAGENVIAEACLAILAERTKETP